MLVCFLQLLVVVDSIEPNMTFLHPTMLTLADDQKTTASHLLS